jgi:hypothetical protein
MFFHAIPLYSRIMFIGITALECFLAIMLLRWDAWKRYPVMSAYLTVQGVGGLAALLTACFGAAMPFFYTNFGVIILLNLIAFGVALELYYKIFDPRIGLSAWRPRHVVIMISVSLGVAITFGLLLAARNGGSLTRTMATLEEVMHVALWATFCTLWIYSRSLGFTWSPRVTGIAMGFILYLTVTVICIFIAARFSLSVALFAGQVAMAAEFLAMAWWLGVFWGEEKLSEASISEQVEEMLSEQVEEMLAQYTNTVEEAARML